MEEIVKLVLILIGLAAFIMILVSFYNDFSSIVIKTLP